MHTVLYLMQLFPERSGLLTLSLFSSLKLAGTLSQLVQVLTAVGAAKTCPMLLAEQ